MSLKCDCRRKNCDGVKAQTFLLGESVDSDVLLNLGPKLSLELQMSVLWGLYVLVVLDLMVAWCRTLLIV